MSFEISFGLFGSEYIIMRRSFDTSPYKSIDSMVKLIADPDSSFRFFQNEFCVAGGG